MKRWITFPRAAGTYSRQAHCALPEGSFEREFGREGFFGPTTHLHHRHAPTGWISWEGPLAPRAFDFARHDAKVDCPWKAPEMLYNAHFRLRFWRTDAKMEHLAANGDGDELLFVHQGSGDLYCDFGHFPFEEGDYILLPRATMWRVECREPSSFLLIEATNEAYALPEKGMVGPHAVFDPAVLDVPELDDAFLSQQHERETQLRIKRRGAITKVTYPYNPLDAIGWHGDNLPVKLNWRDIRPLMSHRYHLPPSAHTTFLARRFVVCTFVPRPAEMDPDALKLPFYHSNNDYDEILFYHKGNFFSRDNIHPGMVTLHPCGFSHGPHPKAFKLVAEAEKTRKPGDPPKMLDEVAVMVDARDAVEIGDAAAKLEWKGYVDSWKEPAA